MAPKAFPDDGVIHVGDVALLDLRSAGDRLHVSDKTLRRLIRDGEITSLLHGGRRLIAEDEITDYMARSLNRAARDRAATARRSKTGSATRTRRTGSDAA